MVGIVLAAGYSSRYPAYKLTQKINNKTLIEHTIDQMIDYVTHIYVVTGHNRQVIETLLEGKSKVTCLYNESYDSGMFASVRKGVMAVKEACFIIPADCPFVSKASYKAILQGKGDIRIPSFNMKAGHPIWLDYTIVETLKQTSSLTLRDHLKKYKKTYINVEDPWILEDIDTESKFNTIKGRLEDENNGSC